MLPEPPDWQTRAACLNADVDTWFPEKGGTAIPAKRVCNGDDHRPPCEVRQECLGYALAHEEDFGVWGGLSERERRRMREPAPGTKPLSSRRCALNGCEGKHYAQGLCQSHYQRRWRERAS